jgi:energy-coupling factor transporter ATP-binding protein EcfA2
MIQSVIIKDRKDCPISYLKDIKRFKNGTKFEFKPGINIIVGPNGCGKTTLMKLIERYMLVDRDKMNYNKTKELSRWEKGQLTQTQMYKGIDVYADYLTTVFRYCNWNELEHDQRCLSSFELFQYTFNVKHASTGEGIVLNLENLFERMFSQDANLDFPVNEIKSEAEYYSKNFSENNIFTQYIDYVKEHKVDFGNDNEYTVLIDEPDRNLDIFNINQIFEILNTRKEKTQLIAVIHNPILIYKLYKNKDINFIEMKKGYIKSVIEEIDKLLK